MRSVLPRSHVSACAGAGGQSSRVPGGLPGAFPGTQLEPIVGPSTSQMSSCFSLASSFLCPLLAWEALLPLTPAGLPETSANPSDFTDIPARNSRTHTSRSAAAHFLTLLLGGRQS